MADETQTTQTTQTEPQAQPGPARTTDGTIIDASKTGTQQTSSTTEGSSSVDPTKPGGGDKPGDTTKPATTGAPEKYEAFTVPEGYTLDEKVNTEAGALFKELGLPQAQAQKLVDFYVAKNQEAIEAPFKAFADMVDGWKSELAKTYGTKLDAGGEHAVAVSKLLSHLGPAEQPFREAMDQTGVGSHPAFVAAFIKLAGMLGEGTDVRGNNPSPLGQSKTGEADRPSAAQAMYPHLPSASAGR